MNGEDKEPTEPLAPSQSTEQIQSAWRHLDDNFETKSKSGASSYRSGRSGTSSQGGYNSRRMKKHQQFVAEESKYHEEIIEYIPYIKYFQPVLGIISGVFLSYWSLIPFAALFFVLHIFTVEDLKKEKYKKYIKVYVFLAFVLIQVVYLCFYLLVNFLVLAGVNATQIILTLILKAKVWKYKTFMEQHAAKDPMNQVKSNTGQKFFNADLVKNLGNVRSQCETKTREDIVKKYQTKFKGKDMPFEVGKAILKEVNENNDMNQLQDLRGQIIKNAKYLVEEQITKLERIQKAKHFSGGISDDSDSRDLVYVFFCGDMQKELYTFVSEKLRRECSSIADKGILAVRIKVA